MAALTTLSRIINNFDRPKGATIDPPSGGAEGVSFGGRTLNPLDALRGPVMTWYYLARQLGEVSPAKQQAIQRLKN